MYAKLSVCFFPPQLPNTYVECLLGPSGPQKGMDHTSGSQSNFLLNEDETVSHEHRVQATLTARLLAGKQKATAFYRCLYPHGPNCVWPEACFQHTRRADWTISCLLQVMEQKCHKHVTDSGHCLQGFKWITQNTRNCELHP